MKMKVLIAESAESQRCWLESELTQWGYEVVSVGDGDTAWSLLSQKDAPPLIVLNGMMVNGLELCRRYRETFHDRPTYIIVLTGQERAARMAGLEAGADSCLSEPIDLEELRFHLQNGARWLASLLREREQAQDFQDTVKALGSTLELDALLQRFLGKLRSVIPYDMALVTCLPDEHLSHHRRGKTWVMACQGVKQTDIPREMELTSYPLLQQVIDEQRPVMLGDVEASPHWTPITSHSSTRSWLGVPLVFRDRVIGLLMFHSHTPHTYLPETADRVFTMAQLAAPMIENARLYGQTRAQLREALLLHGVTAALSSTLDMGQVLPYVARSLAEMLNADGVTIFALATTVDDDARCTLSTLQVVAEHKKLRKRDTISRFPAESTRRNYILTDLPTISRSLDARRPSRMHISDDDLSPQEREFLSARQARSVLFFPLVARGNVIGLTMVWDNHPEREFTQGEIAMGQTLTHQTAIMMENAHLLDETQKHARRIAALYETSRALSSSLDQETLLRTILEAVYRTLGCTYVTIATVDEKTDSVRIRHGIWQGHFDADPEWTVRAPDLPESSDLLTTVYRSGQIKIVEGGYPDHERFLRIFMPIKMREQVIGVVEVGYDGNAKQSVAPEELQMLTAFMDQAAIALENARLFATTERRAREMKFLHDASLAAVNEMHYRDTIRKVARALVAEMGDVLVSVLLLSAEQDLLSLEVAVGYSHELVSQLRLKSGQGISGWVVQHGEPLIVPDVRQDPRYYEGIPETRSELCVPMRIGPFIIGVLDVQSSSLGAFDQDDLHLVSTLAGNLAILVERVRLFNEVEAARAALQERAQALEAANAQLQELDRFKDQFLVSVSHELRTPLNSIIGYADVLLKGIFGDLTPKQIGGVQNILTSAEDLLALINDILDFSKIKAGRMPLDMTTFAVDELLAEVQSVVAPLIEEKRQTLIVECVNGLPPLTADRLRIKQVLLNLLSNAVKFTPSEGTITIVCRTVGSALQISVTDTGPGIREEDYVLIFEEFRQADGPLALRVKGTGLGLAISKRLVEMHGGQIWVESKYGHGATFSFWLPRKSGGENA